MQGSQKKANGALLSLSLNQNKKKEISNHPIILVFEYYDAQIQMLIACWDD
jgi:hypothetical protein